MNNEEVGYRISDSMSIEGYIATEDNNEFGDNSDLGEWVFVLEITDEDEWCRSVTRLGGRQEVDELIRALEYVAIESGLRRSDDN